MILMLNDQGYPIADALALKNALDMIHENTRSPGRVYEVGTYNIIVAMQMLIAKGEIDHKEVSFVIYGTRVEPNQYGACPDMPIGADLISLMLTETLLLLVSKRRKENI